MTKSEKISMPINSFKLIKKTGLNMPENDFFNDKNQHAFISIAKKNRELKANLKPRRKLLTRTLSDLRLISYFCFLSQVPNHG